jgi:NAD-dependent deacetylase
MDELIYKFKDIITKSNQIVAFTGAGLSSESGIPTYRGVGGLWTKYDPSKCANIDYFNHNPSLYWNFFKDVRYPTISKARPNPAHYYLVELERKGILKCVITQNIDGLHQMAGQSNVIELHGNNRRIICINCRQVYSMDEIYRRLDKVLPPKCNCGGKLKPDVVFFGESLPTRAIIDAEKAAKNCDTFLVLGSSLVVYPAAQIPIIAKENGAILVIVNMDTTPLDRVADLVIHKPASHVLSAIKK